MTVDYESVMAFLLRRYGRGYMAAAGVPRALEQCASDMFLDREAGQDAEFIREACITMRTKGFIAPKGGFN